MKTRVLSGVAIALVTIAAGWFGGYTVGFILMICSLTGYFELCRACRVVPEKGQNGLSAAGLSATVIYYLGIMFGGRCIGPDFFTLTVIVLLLLVQMAIYVFCYPKYRAEQVMASLFSFVYCPVMMSFIYRARLLPHGLYVFALIFFCTWICDSCAYFAGRAFGRRKLAPVLSPKKTVEGSVGGILGSVVLCFLLALMLQHNYPEEDTVGFRLAFIVIGFVGAAVSEIGDLAASAIKRNHDIKDYGSCIPGHGGIMDRFDSVIFTTPIIYFLAVLLLT